MRRFISFRDFDWVLLGFVLIICGIGVLEIYSATRQTKFIGFQQKQIYWIIAGLFLMFVVSMVNYQALLENIHWLYGVSVVSLIAVALFGTRVLGAKRWIKLAGGSIPAATRPSNHQRGAGCPLGWVIAALYLAMVGAEVQGAVSILNGFDGQALD